MSQLWCFEHDGQIYGPVPAADLLRLAREGALVSTDRIWRDGAEPGDAVQAGTAISFLPLPERARKRIDHDEAVEAVTLAEDPDPTEASPALEVVPVAELPFELVTPSSDEQASAPETVALVGIPLDSVPEVVHDVAVIDDDASPAEVVPVMGIPLASMPEVIHEVTTVDAQDAILANPAASVPEWMDEMLKQPESTRPRPKPKLPPWLDEVRRAEGEPPPA